MTIYNSFIENMDSFFSGLFENLKEEVSWGTLFTLLMGILIGLVIASTVYAIILFSSLEKKEKEIKKDITNIDDNVIPLIIEYTKNNILATNGDTFLLSALNAITTINSNIIIKVKYFDTKYNILSVTAV